MDKIIELALTSGPAVLLVAAGLVWGKNIIEYFFSEMVAIRKLELDQDLEIHKNELAKEKASFDGELNKALELHKNELEIVKQEYQVQFSHLHQERASVIKQLYAKLLELHSAMVFFTRTMHAVINDAEQEEKERIDRLNTAYADFKNYYLPNKIFFSKAVAAQLDKLCEEYWSKGDDFARTQQFFKSKSIPAESYKYFTEKMNEISDYVIKTLPPLIEELESEFRNILGVKDNGS